MSADLNQIMGDWPYDPASISARWIVGQDGSRKIQLRLDLGVLQMEIAGRPDGQRPHGHETLLEYHQAREPEGGTIALEASDCAELQQEAAQFYYRYIARYALRDLDGVVADTDHNLGIIDQVARCVEDDELAWQFLQFYPYVRMMNARALAERAAEAKLFDEAITELESGIEDIRTFWRDHGDEEDEEDSREIELLADLLGDLRGSRPRTEADLLQEELARAVAAENYERAAMLRDALNVLRKA